MADAPKKPEGSGEAPLAHRESRGRASGKADEGVRRCAKLMADGAWETGGSHELVAAEYGVSVRTVEGWAIQASRTLRLALGDGEELRTRIALQLERHERLALSQKQLSVKRNKDGNDEIVELPNPDVKAATNALKAMAEVMLPKRIEVRGEDVVANFDRMSDEDAVAWLDEKIAQLTALRDKRLLKMGVVPAAPE